MATLGEAINQIAQSAGLPSDNEHLKTFLSSPTISGASFPDEILNAITGNLLTIEAAKNNPTIKSHYVAQSYNAVDKQIEDALGELAIDADTIASLKTIGSTPAKVKAAITKIAELKSKAADASGTDKKELVEKINNLTKQVNDFQASKAAEIETEVSKVKNHYESQFTDMAFSNLLSSEKLANPLGWDASLVLQAAKTVINNELAAKGYQYTRSANGFELTTKEGTLVYDNNQKVEFSDFTKKVLLEKKMLEVAGSSTPPASTTRHTATTDAAPSKGKNTFAAAAAETAHQFTN